MPELSAPDRLAAEVCSRCEGTGEMAVHQCPDCAGTGLRWASQGPDPAEESHE